jgi:hypothetical protein
MAAIKKLEKVGWTPDHIYDTELAREASIILRSALIKAHAGQVDTKNYHEIARNAIEERWQGYDEVALDLAGTAICELRMAVEALDHNVSDGDGLLLTDMLSNSDRRETWVRMDEDPRTETLREAATTYALARALQEGLDSNRKQKKNSSATPIKWDQ